MSAAAAGRRERIAALGYDYAAQPSEAVTSCNLCGATDWIVLTHRDRYGYPARAVACARCGLTVLSPRLAPAAYGRFYESVYRPLVSAYHGRQIDARTVQEEQRPYARAMADLVAEYVAPYRGGRFLDVGGSTGVIAAYFAQRFGLHATVLDPAPAETAEAEALGVRAVTGFVETWQPDGRYEVVGMFQTIDHLLDAKGTLRKLRHLLATDGLFVVDIVDFRAAYLRNGSVEEAVKIDHPYYFTEVTVEALLRRTGLRPILRSYGADHLHITYVCRPAEPEAAALPESTEVREFFREVRWIQNAPAAPRAP